MLASVALAGVAVMVVELTATRLLAPFFGASTYAWTNVVAVVLLALSVGYALGGRLGDRRPSAPVLGRLLMFGALLLAPSPWIGPWLAPRLLGDPEFTDPATAFVPVMTASLVTTLLVFAPPLLLLGAVTPYATSLLVALGWPTGRASGRVLVVSTLGGLLGSYLPAFVLLDAVGSRGTLLVADAVLVIAALPLLAAPKTRALAALGMAALLGATGLAVRGAPLVVSTHGEQAVLERESAYQYVRVARWPAEGGHTAINLALDEGLMEFHSRRVEGGGPLTGAYYDFLAVIPDWIADADTRPLDVLVLGGGAGTLRGLLRALQGPRLASVTDVEIDPAVASLADMFGGGLARGDQSLVADGRVALRAGRRRRFDLIVLDAYARQIAIPAHLGTVEAFREMKAHLTSRGLVAVNVSAADSQSPLVDALVATLSAEFSLVFAVPVPGSWNLELVAGNSLSPDQAVRSRGDVLDPVRVMFRRGWHRVRASTGATVLTDDRAPLERLAREVR